MAEPTPIPMNVKNVEMSFERLAEILMKKLTIWLEDGVAMLPNIVIAALVIIAFIFIARLVKHIADRGLSRVRTTQTIVTLVNTSIYFMVVAVGVFIALGVLNLDKAAASLIAGVGVLGLAIGFAFQEIATNFISGIFIAVSQPFSVGEVVEVKGTVGTVDHISLRTTCLLTDDGQYVDIPNKDMFTSQLKNYSSSGKQKFSVSLNISYACDLAQAKKVIETSLSSLTKDYPDFKFDVYYTAMNDLGAKLGIYYWLPVPSKVSSMKLMNDVIIRTKTDLQNAGIAIPKLGS